MSTRPHTKLFTRVDRTEDPGFFVRFMDEARKPAAIQESKRLMLERSAVVRRDRIVRNLAPINRVCLK